MKQIKPRMTTGEVARLLGCENPEALALLKAAGVESTRATPRAPHLWSVDGVRRLLASLGIKGLYIE